MQFPKLTPLQSRFAASLVATLVLVIIYFSLFPYHFAYAAELDSELSQDYINNWSPEGLILTEGADGDAINVEKGGDLLYESEFVGIDLGIIGRADDGTTALSNNVANNLNLDPGSTNYYTFPNSSVFGAHGVKGVGLPSKFINSRRSVLGGEALDLSGDRLKEQEEGRQEMGLGSRQSSGVSQTVYISINVCSQPIANGTTSATAPQLTLYVSTSSENRKPGPDTADKSKAIVLQEGFANYTLNATADVFIGVHAPTLSDSLSGEWNYDIAASIDAPYHSYDGESAFLFWVDSDTHSALFVTDNLTQANASDDEFEKWLDIGTPFTMFAFASDNNAIKGLQNSYCGMHKLFSQSNVKIESGMTTRGLGNKPKEQFFAQGLNGSSSYYGMLAMRGNSTHDANDVSNGEIVSGGGRVWRALNFTTKTDGNCQLIFNLTFCSEVAYAVPSNPNNFNTSSLAELYDNSTSKMYQNFNYSLQQIPCNTTSTAQYSLARTCADCANDYRNWLCAVTIPRCEDFSSTAEHLRPRNVGKTFINGSSLGSDNQYANMTYKERIFANSSRNPLIDNEIQPGPYKEVLPCEDLCYSLVQSCPALFGFACPLPGLGLEQSYGQRSADGSMTCSYLGSVYYKSSSERSRARPTAVIGIALVALVGIMSVS